MTDAPKIETSKTVKTNVDEVLGKPKYDAVTTTQQAINMATAERRVVRYITDKSREEILSQVDDMKGCKLMKPSKESTEVAIIPEYIKDFSFDTVDTGIAVPSKLIWTP